MRSVIQRVSQAIVSVDNQVVGDIGHGMLVLLGVEHNDSPQDLAFLVKKTVALRIFEDHEGKMNLSIKQVAGQMLVVSQFTLLGDTRKGNRPSFVNAAPPEQADKMYGQFVEAIRSEGIVVQTGVFGANMQVSLINDGPVTILLDSRQSKRTD